MKVAYEVTAIVPPEFVESFEKYMRDRHIGDVLATGYFESAMFSRTRGRYRMRYVAHSRESLDQYLEKDTMRLRDDFNAHFAGNVAVSREVWDVIETYRPAD